MVITIVPVAVDFSCYVLHVEDFGNQAAKEPLWPAQPHRKGIHAATEAPCLSHSQENNQNEAEQATKIYDDLQSYQNKKR